MISFDIHKGGALFDGSARRVMGAAVEAAVTEVANVGVAEVRQELRRVLQHSTGHYASQIQVTNRGSGRLITDGGIVYGPWLAGVPAAVAGTRFRGYAHWRRATERLQADAVTIVEHVLSQRLGAF